MLQAMQTSLPQPTENGNAAASVPRAEKGPRTVQSSLAPILHTKAAEARKEHTDTVTPGFHVSHDEK